MRVLLISHGLPPESVGGVEQHVEGLTAALVAAGHDVHVYTKTGRAGLAQGSLIDEVGPAGAPVTRVVYRYEGLENLAMLYRDPRLDRAFARFLDGRSFDVAHVHHLTGLSTGILDVLAERGIPSVLTLHDYWTICPRGQMWHRDGRICETVAPPRCADCLRPTFGGWVPEGTDGERVLESLHDAARATLARPDALVVPSARAIPPFAALGVPADRIRTIENGVDVERLQRLALPPVDDPKRPLRIAYLGTLIPSKGLDVLVDAIGRLEPGRVALEVFGNAVPYHGDEGFLTRVFSKLRPADQVTYHGPYTTRELPHILALVDLLAAPALWNEAFGLTVREALAAGRPVIVSRVGGLQDAIVDGEQGLVVPPGDAAALADAIRKLDEDRPRLQKMAENCRRAGVTRGFAAMAGELGELYAEVVAGAATA
jgi:glycosyltransferase involved in cell wall biosynthesis